VKICRQCGEKEAKGKRARCYPCIWKDRVAQIGDVRALCADGCGRLARAGRTKCTKCAVGRDAVLVAKRRYRERKAEREGRTLAVRNAKPALDPAEVEQAALAREAKRQAREVERRTADALGITVAALRYRRRYRSDSEFRDQERAKSIEKMALDRARRGAQCDGSLDGATVRRLFATADDCAYCGEGMHPRDKTLDHVVPMSRGGSHSLLNAVVCCRRCNASKGARTVSQWIASGCAGVLRVRPVRPA
jgi:5-methylcytosine-specific restriction endonuclease McrA